MKLAITQDQRRIAAYDVIGSGDVLLCVPGGPGFPGDQLGELGGMDQHRTLVRVDLRGAGESDEPIDASWSFDEYARDLEMVRRALKVDRVDLFGHAHGALIAAKYALMFPEHVRSLVLDAVPVRSIEELDVQGEFEVSSYYTQYNQRAKTYEKKHMTAMFEPALAWFWDNEVTMNFGDLVRSVPVRTLLITGSDDPLGGAEPTRKVAADMANGEAAVLDAAGHFPWVEQPDAFVAIVEKFLSGVTD